MKLEDQVCTQKQSVQLTKLGIEGNPIFAWVDGCDEPERTAGYNWTDYPGHRDEYHGPAWTVAELGEMLPQEDDRFAFSSFYNPHFGNWVCECRDIEAWQHEEDLDTPIPPMLNDEEGDTEAEARANMLIYLLENQYVTAEEVNKRLNG